MGMEHRVFCKDAQKLLRIHVVCGKDCPIYDNCPRLILEDGADRAIETAIKRMIEIRGDT